MENKKIIFGVAILAIIVLVVAFMPSSPTPSDPNSCFVDNGTKSYTLMSPEQCQVAKFACAEDSEFFSDLCGCGCKALMPVGKLAPISCTNEQRAQTSCDPTEDDYGPVCGWFNENVSCFAYPCAIDYSNICEACRSPNVAYYTGAKCPSPDIRA